MLIGLSQKQIQEWNSSLHIYEKAKRTKRPFGKLQVPQRKSVHDIVQKQMKFNPILQSFRDERELSKTIEHQQLQKKNNYKYTTDYDIINFSDSISLPSPLKGQSMSVDSRKKEYKDPHYQDYDIVNNSAYREGYLQKIGYKPVKHYHRNIQAKNDRTFNIVTGKYSQNHEEQHSREVQESRAEALNREKDLRIFDSLNGRFYDQELERNYQTLQREQQRKKIETSRDQIPPSYINREPLILNDNPETSQTIKALDQKKEMSKQRYKMKYILDEQYHNRNEYLTDKKDQQAFKRVHNGRILENKAREFNILNSQRYASNRAEQLFGKEITGSPYELRPLASPIKHHGF